MNTSDTNQNKEMGQLTPDMAGYRPSREWWPDLTNHRKIMLLHGITTEQIDKLLKEYADICCDVKKVPAAFYYARLPEHPEWVCLEFPNFEKIHHAQNFETYQNLLLWVSDQSDREFCLALPEQQNGPLFFSTVDRKIRIGIQRWVSMRTETFTLRCPEGYLSGARYLSVGFTMPAICRVYLVLIQSCWRRRADVRGRRLRWY